MDANQPWKFKFKDYLEVVVWDRWPGRTYDGLQLFVLRLLNKAFRLPNQIAIRGRSLTVFHRIACEEEGADSKNAQQIKYWGRDRDVQALKLTYRTNKKHKGRKAEEIAGYGYYVEGGYIRNGGQTARREGRQVR